jgi:hypothetical protein
LKKIPSPVQTEVCDFCGQPEIWARYPAQSFTYRWMGSLALNSGGDWLACRWCADMISQEDWEGLLEHAIRAFLLGNPNIEEDFVRREVARLQA